MQTKTVKSKIIYPHLGIVDEVEEEILEIHDEDHRKRKEGNANEI